MRNEPLEKLLDVLNGSERGLSRNQIDLLRFNSDLLEVTVVGAAKGLAEALAGGRPDEKLIDYDLLFNAMSEATRRTAGEHPGQVALEKLWG